MNQYTNPPVDERYNIPSRVTRLEAVAEVQQKSVDNLVAWQRTMETLVAQLRGVVLVLGILGGLLLLLIPPLTAALVKAVT